MARLVRCLTISMLAACQADAPITVATYNLGLAEGFVAATAARAPLATAAVGELEADVVCVQEVWQPDHVELLTEASADRFAHSVFPEPSPQTVSEPACAEGELDVLMQCVEDSCGDVCDDELVDCVFDHCAFDYLELDGACQGCVQTTIGADASAVRTTCEVEYPQYAYGGSFGTGVLSAHPILDSTEHVFSSTTNRRGVTHARIDSPHGEIDVFCTHLTAIFTLIPYPKDEGSWADEQLAQIDELRGFVDDQVDADAQVVVLGDFNTSPSLPEAGIDADHEEHLTLLATGYTSPYLDQAAPECTMCTTNPLNADKVTDEIIDHVLLRGFEGAMTVERLFDDEPVEVDRCGEPFTTALSDHYGVSVRIE